MSIATGSVPIKRREDAVSFPTNRATVIAVVTLSALVFVLYVRHLTASPLYLHHDEVFFGVQAHAIATTGHDTHGRFLPIYFQVFANLWFQPVLVYFTALFFRVLPVSEQSLRLPSVFVGLCNIVLLYFVARRIFVSSILAMLAACMLALTPAHFIFSRLAYDCLYPVTFLLAWLLCLLAFHDRPSLPVLFAATTLLGVGFYSYIAAQAMMSIYLAATLAIVAIVNPSWKMFAVAVAGFCWPLSLSAPFHLRYPEFAADTILKYGPAAGLHLNPFQAIRELFSYTNLSARVTLYFNYFNPGYLFLSGAPNTLVSTRHAGVFLLPVAIFLPVGIYQVCHRHRTDMNLLLVFGFATAPLAALVVFDSGAIDRELELLPFGVLLAVYGVSYMWSAPLRTRLRPYYLSASILGVMIGGGYGLFTLLTQGRLSGSVLPLLISSAVIYMIGAASERMGTWRAITASLLLLGILEFSSFYLDYFSDYPIRTAARFEGNVRGALDEVIRREDPRHPVKVYLSNSFQFIESYWAFYAAKHRRDDLVALAQSFDAATIDVSAVPEGSFFVTVVGARADEALTRRPDVVTVARALEPDGTPSFIVLQKTASSAR